MYCGLGDTEWRIAALLPVLVMGMLSAEGQAQAQEADENAVFSLSSVPRREQVYRGEPLFVKVTLRNTSARKVRLVQLPQDDGIGGLSWRLQVAEPGSHFRDVELNSAYRSMERPDLPFELNPNEAAVDHLTIWYAASGDVPGERSLVFPRSGVYRYRIAFGVALAVGPFQKGAADGTIKVTGRPRGFGATVRTLRETIGDNAAVSYKHAGKLDSLLTELGSSSPYSRYVKWLRIRSYLRGGLNNRTLAGDRAAREAGSALLWGLSESLLADAARAREPPIVRDALTMKAIVLIGRGEKTEARELCDKLYKAFAPTPAMKRLRARADHGG